MDTKIINQSAITLPSTPEFKSWTKHLSSLGQEVINLDTGAAPTGFADKYGDCLYAYGQSRCFGTQEFGSFSIKANKRYSLA